MLQLNNIEQFNKTALLYTKNIMLTRSIVLILFISLPFQLCATLDLSIDEKDIILNSAKSKSSTFEQQKLLKEFIRQIRATGKLNTSPEISAYIRQLGNKLNKYGSRNIEFLVLNDKGINAFAGLGGVVVINTGLILTAKSEGELASVIAHEIAHVSQYHIERIIESTSSGASASLQAILIAAAIVSAGTDPSMSQAALVSAFALPAEQMVTHTRVHEAEADSIGLKILVNAGYSSDDMASMFQRFLALNKFSSSPPQFLLTHPLTESRIASLQNLAQSLQKSQVKTNNDDFKVIRAILKNDKLTANELQQIPSKIVYAIELYQAGNKELAKDIVKAIKIDNKNSKSVYFKLLLGQFYSISKQKNLALKWLQKAYQQQTDNLATVIRYSKELLQQGQTDKAFKILQLALKIFNNQPEVYKLMAHYYAIEKNIAQSYFWRAKSEFLAGYTKRAVQQLLIAKKSPNNDFYLSSKIDALIEQYKNVVALEQRK